MITTKIFTRTNNNWENCAESNKAWADWKASYKRAHAKARIKAQAKKGYVKFGADNSAARQETAQGV